VSDQSSLFYKLHGKKRRARCSTGLNNVLLPTLFTLVNNIEQCCWAWIGCNNNVQYCWQLWTMWAAKHCSILFSSVLHQPERFYAVASLGNRFAHKYSKRYVMGIIVYCKVNWNQFPAHNTKWLKNGKLHRAILSAFYNISQRNFWILLILWCSFKLW
jgi:hypothetical protein